MIWPSPEPVVLTVRTAAAWLELPVRPPAPEDDELEPFAPPLAAPGSQHRKLTPMKLRRVIQIDLTTSEMVYTLKGDGGEFGGASLARLDEIDLELGYTQEKRYRIIENDPLSAEIEFEQAAALHRSDWDIKVDCRTKLSVQADAFLFTGALIAYENDAVVSTHRWTISIPRQFL